MLNGTYWAGTALGAASTLILLNPRYLPHDIGWRLCFGIGGILGFSVLLVRRHLPESPRWLLLHGREDEARRIVEEIEKTVSRELKKPLPQPGPPVPIRVRGAASFSDIGRVLFKKYRARTVLGFVMMVSQAFAYNAIFFTYALVLSRFYGVPSSKVGLYLLPFAAGNLCGPLILGHLFDTIGRRVMISATYGVSGLLLAGAGYAFMRGWLTAATQTELWCLVFFFASAAASSAYLTVSELFPVEMRGMVIALFYAVGIAVGGAGAPALFGLLIQSGNPARVFGGYLLGAFLMIAAAASAAVLGVSAERKSLEAIAGLKDVS